MAFPTGARSARTRLALEHLEDRATPATLADLVAAGEIAGDRVIVVMNSLTNSPTDVPMLSSAPGVSGVKALGAGMYSVRLTAGTDLEGAINSYRSLPGVAVSEADGILRTSLAPNDPRYNTLYGLRKIGAPAAWDTTTGNPNFVAAVIDTGIDYSHPDMYLNTWINQAEIPAAIRPRLTDVNGDGVISFRDLNNPVNIGTNTITDLNGNGYIDGGDLLRTTAQGGWSDNVDADGNGYSDDLVGWDFVNDDNDPFDDNEHGTHVGGTMGAVGNNNVGVVGVNWSITLMGLKFLGASGGGTTSDAIAAINYSVDMGVKVSNNSWGGSFTSTALSLTVNRTKTAGQIFVAAAGNDGEDNDTVTSTPSNYTTRYDNVVAVAATDSNDALAGFSNFGATSVTLGAPGVNILSAMPGGGYQLLDGTSMASPHVAGAVSLFWSANPTLTYTQVINHLKSTVDPVSGLSGLVSTGGRLNVGNMFATPVAPLPPPVVPPPPPPPAAPTGPAKMVAPPVVVNAPVGSPVVRVLAPGGTTKFALTPHPGFLGGIVAAAGDVTGDGVADVVTAATVGGHVKVFNGATGAELSSFFAFQGYIGAVSLAAGDITGDGIADVIVSANKNGHVKVINGLTGALTFSTLAYSGYTGPTGVTVADVNGDGRNDLITGGDQAAGVHIKVFDGQTQTELNSFIGTEPGRGTGFSLSAGDLDGDGVAVLLVSQGARVSVLKGVTNLPRARVFPFEGTSNNRITVQAAQFDTDAAAELVAIEEIGGRSQVRAFNLLGLSLIDSFFADTR